MTDGDGAVGPYSHPPEDGRDGVLLIDHLRDVRDRVEMVLPSDATTAAGESRVNVVERLALVHDLGKATEFFQQYIDVEPGSPKSPKLRHHSPLGALAAYAVLDEVGYDEETCVTGFVAVAKHHGRLPAVARYLADTTNTDGGSERRVVLRNQLRSILTEHGAVARTVFEAATGDEDALSRFAAGIDDGSLLDEIRAHVVRDRSNTVKETPFSETLYGDVLACWGALVLADKTSAAGAPSSADRYNPATPSIERLTTYIQGLEDNTDADPDGDRTAQLNHHRSRARREILNNVEEFCEADADVATLTLPTGVGKTLSGLNAALSIRERTGGNRVMYALPFTSIIDQVVDEATDIFSTSGTDGVLATDHHLADTRIDPAEAHSMDDTESAYDTADRNDDVAGMLANSWRAGLTVTTFVQLFESLAGPRNTQSMKLPALEDSIVILDEPQSLPLDWWSLVRRLVDVLTTQYDATVISMTATQPELFADPFRLVDDVDDYFSVAERIDYHLHDSVERFLDDSTAATPAAYATAAETLVDDTTDGTAALAICNTIDSARELTEAVTDRLPIVDVATTFLDDLDTRETTPSEHAHSEANENASNEGRPGPDGRDAARTAAIDATVDALAATEKTPFLHLSSRMRPADRIALVRILKRLREADVPVLAITTQVIEAGVDVSFEAVYRDLAPIDSIVQAAGRCNRSFDHERGRATVWWLDAPGDQSKTPAVAVYDSDTALTPVTAAALDHVRDGDGPIAGKHVTRDAVTDYYRRLHDDKDVGRDEYAAYVDTTNGDALNDLSLIDSPRAVDVIVCRTPSDHELVDELETAYQTYSFDRIDDLQDRTKPLRISVPIYDVDSDEADVLGNLPPLFTHDGDAADVRVLKADSRQYEKYFDDTTGFVVPDSTLESRFL